MPILGPKPSKDSCAGLEWVEQEANSILGFAHSAMKSCWAVPLEGRL